MQKVQPQTQINLVQRLQERFHDAITKKPFPSDRLSTIWKMGARRALGYASPASLGVNADVFKTIVGKMDEDEPQLSFFEFATVSNNMEAKSARDLGMPMDSYLKLISECQEHVKFYSEAIPAIRKKAEESVAAEDKAKADAPVGFGKIKAEA